MHAHGTRARPCPLGLPKVSTRGDIGIGWFREAAPLSLTRNNPGTKRRAGVSGLLRGLFGVAGASGIARLLPLRARFGGW